MKPEDFASCTTDSGSDIRAMCVNQARDFGIQWDWCTSHMVNKACEHAFCTSLDPAKSKNKLARDMVQLAVTIIKRIANSPTWRAKFEDIQVPHVPCLRSLKTTSMRTLLCSQDASPPRLDTIACSLLLRPRNRQRHNIPAKCRKFIRSHVCVVVLSYAL